jgi:hypothetical protein
VGLARELSEGPNRRHRGAGRLRLDECYIRLRALTKLAERGTLAEGAIPEIRALIEEVAARPARMRFDEGAIYNAACSAYRKLTGETVGPETGVSE